MNEFAKFLTLGLCLLTLANVPIAIAQSGEKNALLIELNKVENEGAKCAITFLVGNRSGSDLKKLSYGIVLFDSDLRVERITALDFGEIAAGRSRVRKFGFPDTDCAKLGQILINDTKACDVEKGSAVDCDSSLELANRTNLKFIK